MAESVPITTLLSWVWIAHTIEVDNAFEVTTSARVGRAVRISLPMWANGLRLIEQDGVTIAELRTRARAACNLAGLERRGWISIGDVGEARRDGFGTRRGLGDDVVVRPTRAGSYARRVWPRAVHEVEDRWRTRFGGPVVDRLRRALLAQVTPVSWSPPEVHPSDGFRTHVLGEADVHDAARDDDRPLVALLGQVLTARTVRHERDARVSRPLGADLLRVVGTGAVRTRELPALTGLSKEGIAMATGYLERNGLAAVAPDRAIHLTPAGLEALDNYHRQSTQPDQGLRAPLEGVVSQGEALAAGLVPPEGCWRADRVQRTRTSRLLADPTAALPWQPMVLHRGGWPDAS